jgi:hypothetical protein
MACRGDGFERVFVAVSPGEREAIPGEWAANKVRRTVREIVTGGEEWKHAR